jgi:hypothetical protein
MSDEIKKPEEITDAPVLSDTDLEQVAGGTPHLVDASSPVLVINTANGKHYTEGSDK